MRSTVSFAACFTCLAAPALAEPLRVVVDTAPLHSLVARVMDGVGTPELLLPPGGSPHDVALRPSDARRLSQADLVVWTGPAFLPWFSDSLAALAPEAEALAVLELEGWERLPLRQDPAFETEEEEGEGEGEGYDHGHGHDALDAAQADPHAWLDPVVAASWMERLAETLAETDPENAGTYRENATVAIEADTAMSERIAARLAPLSGRPYLVPHDAYQYFERRFDVPASGALALSDASAPGPARIAELRDKVEIGGIVCVLSDPETPADLVALLREDSSAATAPTDPDGLMLTPGPDLYPALIEGLAVTLEECLG
ncbi:zinc ABC transporter, periplasmic-binding protein ZnuA [Limimaricola cinnabarinus LL-001]|uniref:High-affinity zinc uptake system protein ZnuA n=1 Tax=Limimaricola cinnabarinus LL-001 TaxID=1337093 RepID=U3AH61_9RHOB|nr:zinc ABC transporter, periplasmic-binding protein ZnuA [Limimaricola cinnabarinus LL-001]